MEAKFRGETEPVCSKDFFFFGLYQNLGAKFWTEIQLLRLTKLRKTILPFWNLLNQQKIDAYAYQYEPQAISNIKSFVKI